MGALLGARRLRFARLGLWLAVQRQLTSLPTVDTVFPSKLQPCKNVEENTSTHSSSLLPATAHVTSQPTCNLRQFKNLSSVRRTRTLNSHLLILPLTINGGLFPLLLGSIPSQLTLTEFSLSLLKYSHKFPAHVSYGSLA